MPPQRLCVLNGGWVWICRGKAGHGGLTRAGMDVAATLGRPVSEETKHISSQAWAIAAHCCPGKNGLKREWLSPGNANSSHEEFSGCAGLASQVESRVGESTSITGIIPRWQCWQRLTTAVVTCRGKLTGKYSRDRFKKIFR